MPKVSVIIPTYNYGKYIEKAIDSVLAQTYKDFEIIVVDDGSTDNTREIIQTRYKDKVRYFYQENKGAPVARNKGIKESKGEYLAFLDQDDLFHPLNLEKKVDFLDSNSEFGWVYSDYTGITEPGFKKPTGNITRKGSAAKYKISGHISKQLIEGYLLSTPSTVMIRRNVIDKAGCFDEKISHLEDYDLWLRISYWFPIGFIDQELCTVLYHKNSSSSMFDDRDKYYSSRIRINHKIETMYPDLAVSIGLRWKKIKSDEYNYLCMLHFDKRNFKTGFRYFIKSVCAYPFQGGIYVIFLKYLWTHILGR